MSKRRSKAIVDNAKPNKPDEAAKTKNIKPENSKQDTSRNTNEDTNQQDSRNPSKTIIQDDFKHEEGGSVSTFQKLESVPIIVEATGLLGVEEEHETQNEEIKKSDVEEKGEEVALSSTVNEVKNASDITVIKIGATLVSGAEDRNTQNRKHNEMGERDEHIDNFGLGKEHKEITASIGGRISVIPETEDETDLSVHSGKEEPDKSSNRITASSKMFHRIMSLQSSQRSSTVTFSQTAIYDNAPRFKQISISTEEFLFTEPKANAIPSLRDDEVEITEEEEKEEFDQENIHRQPLIDKYDYLRENINTEQFRNYVLNRMVNMILMRKLGENMTRYANIYSTKTYRDKLTAYNTLLELSVTQRATVSHDLEDQKLLHANKRSEVQILFTALQDREIKIGNKLIDTKTGIQISDNHVARLIRQQKFYFDKICSMRLTYLKLRVRVEEKVTRMRELENKGSGLQLADYEQMKIKSRSYRDKIEEKECDLAKLRIVCAHHIQTLAHLREKLQALESDLLEASEDFAIVNYDHLMQRRELNDLRRERDQLRQATDKLKEETGLLLYPSLILDMEKSSDECTIRLAELENLKEQCDIKANQVRSLRNNIERLTKEKNKTCRTSTMGKTRTTLISEPKKTLQTQGFVEKFPVPKIDQRAFTHLGKILTGQCLKKKRKL